jgi:hypothetical protein
MVENITGSFAFAVAEQILEATNIPALSRARGTSTAPNAHHTMDRLQHPVRRSSLPPPASTPDSSNNNPIAMLKYLENKLVIPPGEDELKVVATDALGALAGNRADLLLLQRQIVERVADNRGWRAGLSRLRTRASLKAAYTDVDLNEGTNDSEDSQPATSEASDGRGIVYSALLDALSSLESFAACYDKLTNQALSQCVLALRAKTAERLIADLAVMEFDNGNPTTAASYLSRVIPTFADYNWSQVETELAKIHVQCLKKLNRKDDYVRMGLGIITRAAARKKASMQFRIGSSFPDLQDGDDDESEALFEDFLSVSEELPCDIIVPFTDFFIDLYITPFIEHFEDKDGFSLDIKFRYLRTEALAVDSVRLKLRCIDPPFRELWAEAFSIVVLGIGSNRVKLNAQVCGYYLACG